MGRITVDMIRKRAEHNEGMIGTLEELALHQQHIERIELLHRICRHLKILLFQNNLIHTIQNLHRLKELQYLNLALNNITKVQNLQRCESLNKLDLTMNFVPKEGLLSVRSLRANEHLADLYLMGNPCSDWPGYRQYVVATLPGLARLDGKDIKPSERISAQQAFDKLQAKLQEELVAEGIDVEKATQIEDDGLDYDSDAEIEDPGAIDPQDGEFKRPWCRETRILEHRENERTELEQQRQKQAGQQGGSSLFAQNSSGARLRWDDFPEIKDGEPVFQKNEGDWDFTLDETDSGAAVELDVQLGMYIDTTLVKADVQPGWVRLLAKGRLLQLRLPCDVRPDESEAQRSKASGRLVLTMPKLDPSDTAMDLACVRSKPDKGSQRHLGVVRQSESSAGGNRAGNEGSISDHAHVPKQGRVNLSSIVTNHQDKLEAFTIKAVRKAPTALCVADSDDDAPAL